MLDITSLPAVGAVLVIAPIPLVVMIVGLLIWALVKDSSIIRKIGEYMFLVGLIWLVYPTVGQGALRLGAG